MRKDSLGSSIKSDPTSEQEKTAHNILVGARKIGLTLGIIARLLSLPTPKTHRLIRSKCRNIKLRDYNNIMRLGDINLNMAQCCRCTNPVGPNEINEFKFTGDRSESIFVCDRCAGELEQDTNQFWKRAL